MFITFCTYSSTQIQSPYTEDLFNPSWKLLYLQLHTVQSNYALHSSNPLWYLLYLHLRYVECVHPVNYISTESCRWRYKSVRRYRNVSRYRNFTCLPYHNLITTCRSLTNIYTHITILQYMLNINMSDMMKCWFKLSTILYQAVCHAGNKR
jgi:hypothetical protein